MKIVVIGGSGLIEEDLADGLQLHGHEAMAASPACGVDSDVANLPSFQEEAASRFQPNAAYSRLGRYVP